MLAAAGVGDALDITLRCLGSGFLHDGKVGFCVP